MPVVGSSHRAWTSTEDELLASWQSKIGNRWAMVALHIPGRSGQQCAQRWRHKVNPNIRKERWTESEDEQLTQLFHMHGNAWAEISRQMNGRTDQQCMGRWRRHLDPRISKEPWKKEEDVKLRKLFRKHGNQWSTTAKSMPGRTPQQCRVRWYQMDSAREEQPAGKKSQARRCRAYVKDSDNEEWSGASDTDGIDFEKECQAKARNRRLSSSRRQSTVSGAFDDSPSESSSGSQEGEGFASPRQYKSPSSPKTQPIIAKGTPKGLRSGRKGRGKKVGLNTPSLGLSTPFQGAKPPCDDSEGCETVLNKQPVCRSNHRAIRPANSPARDQTDSTSNPGDLADPTIEAQAVDDPARPGAWPERPLNRRCRLKPRSLSCPDKPREPLNVKSQGVEDLRDTSRRDCSQPSLEEAFFEEQAVYIDPMTLPMGLGAPFEGRHWDSTTAPEAAGALDLESPPLVSQQMPNAIMPRGSEILTASHFELTSPSKHLLSSSQGCPANATPRRSSRLSCDQSNQQSSRQTPLTGSKRSTPGGGFTRDAWEISPTENVLNLFQSPDPGRGRSNPLQSPSFQSLATPEWARRDWMSPAVAQAKDSRAGTPGHRQNQAATAGKPSRRGSVARRLDVNQVSQTAGEATRPNYNLPLKHSNDSPAKKLRPGVKDAPQETGRYPGEKEHSACDALKRLSMAAFALETSGEEASSVDTQVVVAHGLPKESSPGTEGKHVPISARQTPRSKLSSVLPAQPGLMTSEALRSRLHALLDGP